MPRFEGLKLDIPEILRAREDQTIGNIAAPQGEPLPLLRDVQPPPTAQVSSLGEKIQAGQPRDFGSFIQEARGYTRGTMPPIRRAEDLLFLPFNIGTAREDATRQLALGLAQKDAQRKVQERIVQQAREEMDLSRTGKFFDALEKIVSLPDAKLRPKYLASVAKAFKVEIDPAIQAHFVDLADNSPDTLEALGANLRTTPWSFLSGKFKDPVQALDFITRFEQSQAREATAVSVAQGKTGPKEAAQAHGAAILAGMGAAEQQAVRGALEAQPTVAQQLGELPEDFLSKADIEIQTDQAGKQRVTAKMKSGSSVDFTNEADREAAVLGEKKYSKKNMKFADLPVWDDKQAVLQQIQKNAVERSAQQGAAAVLAQENVRRGLPMEPKESAGFIHPKTMEAPPAGMTKAEAIQQGYRFVTDTQRADLSELLNVHTIVGQMKALTNQLITAKDWPTALAQGVTLEAGARSRANPIAAVYEDQKQAFLGVISRRLGGERGVLTDRDIKRISDSLPKFHDTVAIKDIKNAFLTQLLDVAISAKQAAVLGQPLETSREQINKQIDSILTTLGQATAPPSNSRVPKVEGFRWGK